MSTTLIDLNNRIVTDEGEIIAKPSLCLERILSGKTFKEYRCVNDKDVEVYNKRNPIDPIKIWKDDGNLSGPPKEAFEWTYPKRYDKIDILKRAISWLQNKNLLSDQYIERLEQEYLEIEKREMESFIRCLLYITDEFRKHDIVWGVGRGSSCASLMLYALGINKIDPIKYDIPMEEFFK
mgnify:CR=1 FL=1